MNLIHELFNQYFTQKYSDHNFKFTSNITNIYVWRSNLITTSKSLMFFLWHMLFSACVKWQIFCGIRFISTCEDGFFKNCATFNFGITRGSTCVLCCSGCVLIQSVTNWIRVNNWINTRVKSGVRQTKHMVTGFTLWSWFISICPKPNGGQVLSDTVMKAKTLY